MSDHTYRVAEIVGSSPVSLQQAIRNGVERASQTLRNLEWFEVSEIRGQIADGGVQLGHAQHHTPGGSRGARGSRGFQGFGARCSRRSVCQRSRNRWNVNVSLLRRPAHLA